MPLTPGTRLGPYEIVSPLGAGGMGEVYRARDTRLGRDVALKVLPQHLAATPEIRARFEREARSVSSLNHPHICTLFDVGREGEIDYLVMELIEGETLADRLARGALPMDQVLRLGAEVADALDKAHRSGIVHRDLKPGNVMLTKNGAKLMDFGLARATGLAGPGSGSGVTIAGLSQSPTIAQPLTAEGSLVGTYQYMSPEQLEGREADARSDIWAFGCVLYEMATGKRAFDGRSQASLITSIMSSSPPPISQVAAVAPPALDRLVGQCLEKDPDNRWQSASDMKRELEWISRAGSQAGVPAAVGAQRRSRERLAWTLAAAFGVAALALAIPALLRRPPAPEATRFNVGSSTAYRNAAYPRISPDGRLLAFQAMDTTGKLMIWIRPMNSLAATPIAGTDAAGRPFWSPDSRYLAYVAGLQLKKVPVTGGPPQLICEVRSAADGSWGASNTILLDGGATDTLRQVNASGGEPTPLTTLNRKRGELYHAWPHFLPDGKHFLFLSYAASRDSTRLCAGELGSSKVKYLGRATSRVEYCSQGYVVYGADGTLMARPFDAGALRFRGEPFPVAEQVESNADNVAFSVSATGTLAYLPSGSGDFSRLVWVDRTGKELSQEGALARYRDFTLSQDGSKLVYSTAGTGGSGSDLWLWDVRRSVATKLTFDNENDEIWPVFSPDGQRIAFAGNAGGVYEVRIMAAGGSGGSTLLYRGNGPSGPHDWSGDGRTILFTNYDAGAGNVVVQAADSSSPAQFVFGKTPAFEAMPKFSPDARWIAYRSDESGRAEVYVQPCPATGAKWQISTAGGSQPWWRGDGKELYYLDRSNTLMAVPMTLTPSFQPGVPVALFQRALTGGALPRNRYLSDPSGQRFLLNVPVEAAQAGMVVVQNWVAEAPRR